MKKNQIQIGHMYVAKVSGKLVAVNIDRENPNGGWDGTNMVTKRAVRIHSARRLRKPAQRSFNPPMENAQRLVTAANAAIARALAPEPQEYDPDCCTTADCGRPPAMTYTGKPLCQACWEWHCRAMEAGAAHKASASEGCEETTTAGSAVDANAEAWRVGDEQEANQDKENDMATNKKSKTNKTKVRPTAAKRTKKDPAVKKPKRVSALDAAAQVLAKAKEPMGSKALVEAMAAAGLWKSPGGATPHATLYSAMIREITTKGKASRFKKTDRGMFCAA